MKSKLLFRLDDICPGLKYDNLIRLEEIFDKYGVKPMLGIVPCNEDSGLVVEQTTDNFWEEMIRLQTKGWSVALHGYKHVYVNECSGILEANPFSEFAGVDLETQKQMISDGKHILEGHGLKVDYFMAPGHTFDENTLTALADAGIWKITDGYTKQPYIRGGITFYPCKLSEAKLVDGMDTVCIHLNNWQDKDFEELEEFLKSNSDCVIEFSDAEASDAVTYNSSVAKQERQFRKLKERKNKAASSEVMQKYLRASYSTNRYVKLIKRVVMLPLLLKESLRNVLKVIIFLCILAFAFRSLSYIMRTNGDAKDRMTGFYSEEENSIDVLMFGSSTVGTSFIPAYMWKKYGFTSYALSTNAQRPKAIKYLIEEGIRYQDPKLVVIELRTFPLEDSELATDEGHIREVVDNMKYSWHRIETINALAEQFEDKLPFYIDIMKYHSNIGMLTLSEEWKKYNGKSDNLLKGYEVMSGVRNSKDRDEDFIREYNHERIKIPNNQEIILIDLLEYLRRKELPALFVITPRDHDDVYEGNMCYIKDIIDSYGYEVIDINEEYVEAQIDYGLDMNDGAHTNIWGATKVSDYIGRRIEKYVGRSDHSINTINDWNDAYVYFEEILTNTQPEEK